jgi:hypothetical protein
MLSITCQNLSVSFCAIPIDRILHKEENSVNRVGHLNLSLYILSKAASASESYLSMSR